MTRAATQLLVSALLLTLAACSAKPGKTLSVQVLTDFVAGPEFASIETELLDSRPLAEGATRLAQATTEVRFGANFARGRNVATFDGQSSGEKAVRVTLVRPNGTRLHARTVRFAMASNDYALTVHLTRDCVDLQVECPLANAPALTQCLMGQCVDERCNPQDPATAQYCPEVSFCQSITDCRGVSECSSQLCEEGICSQTPLTPPTAGACDDGEWCDPVPNTGGCRTLPTTLDDGGVNPDEIVCDTVCFLPGEPCKFGAWNCEDPLVPACVYLGNRPEGTACGTGAACSAGGLCVTATDGGADAAEAGL